MTSLNSTQRECTGAETLVPGVLRGYRTWETRWHDDLAWSPTGLFSLSFDAAWDVTMEAECLREVPDTNCDCDACLGAREWGIFNKHAGIAPDSSCRCGIYAWYDFANADPTSLPIVAGYVGVVEASGKILMGTKGFRAQRARIIAVAPYWNERYTTNRFMEKEQVDTMLRDVRDRQASVREKCGHLGIAVFPTVPLMQAEFPPDNVDTLLEGSSSDR